MVTTFIRLAGSHTKAVWNFLQKASQVDIRLAELGAPLIEKNVVILFGKGPHLYQFLFL